MLHQIEWCYSGKGHRHYWPCMIGIALVDLVRTILLDIKYWPIVLKRCASGPSRPICWNRRHTIWTLLKVLPVLVRLHDIYIAWCYTEVCATPIPIGFFNFNERELHFYLRTPSAYFLAKILCSIHENAHFWRSGTHDRVFVYTVWACLLWSTQAIQSCTTLG